MRPLLRRWRPPRLNTVRLAVLLGVGAAVLHATWAITSLAPRFHKYPVAARALLDGTLSAERRLDFSPLYLWLTAALEALGFPSPVALTVLQCALVGLACAAVMLTLRGWAGLAAAALLCLDGGLLLHGGVQEPEVLLLALMAGMLWAATHRSEGMRRFTGPFQALAMLVRPSSAPWAFFAVIQWWWRGPRRTRVAQSGGLLCWVAVASGALWLWSGGGPVMNPGTVFFEGNNPASVGLSATYPPAMLHLEGTTQETSDVAHVLYRDLARAELGAQATPSQVNSLWSQKALHHLADAPGVMLRRNVTKFRVAFAAHSSHDIPTLFLAERDLPPLLPFGVLAALALCGAAFSLRWRRGGVLLWGMVAVQTAVLVVIYASARQRLTLLLPLTLLAGLSLRSLWHFRTARIPMMLALCVGAVLLNIPTSVPQEDAVLMLRGLDAGARARRAEQGMEAGHPEQAVDDVVKALAEAPWLVDDVRPADLPVGRTELLMRARQEAASLLPQPTATFHAAFLSLELGDAKDARARLATLPADFRPVARARFSPSMHYFQAWACVLAGQREQATPWLQRALQDVPGEPFSLALLAALGEDADGMRELSRLFSTVDAHLLLGEACLRVGNAACATPHLEWLQHAFPGWRSVAILQAAAHAMAEDAAGARQLYAQAMVLGASPVLGDPWLRPLFANGTPTDVEDAWARVRSLRQFGERDLARAMLNAARANGLDSRALQAEGAALSN